MTYQLPEAEARARAVLDRALETDTTSDDYPTRAAIVGVFRWQWAWCLLDTRVAKIIAASVEGVFHPEAKVKRVLAALVREKVLRRYRIKAGYTYEINF